MNIGQKAVAQRVRKFSLSDSRMVRVNGDSMLEFPHARELKSTHIPIDASMHMSRGFWEHFGVM